MGKITLHVLRASAVTFLKQQGFPDSDIMGVTGHASSEMVYANDKRSRADNASKKVIGAVPGRACITQLNSRILE